MHDICGSQAYANSGCEVDAGGPKEDAGAGIMGRTRLKRTLEFMNFM
jgi:hypothetical protein